jgi:hypothetical protein
MARELFLAVRVFARARIIKIRLRRPALRIKDVSPGGRGLKFGGPART